GRQRDRSPSLTERVLLARAQQPGPVRAAQILEHEAVDAADDARVLTGDQRVTQDQIIGRRASDAHAVELRVEYAAGTGAGSDLEAEARHARVRLSSRDSKRYITCLSGESP